MGQKPKLKLIDLVFIVLSFALTLASILAPIVIIALGIKFLF